MSLFAASSQAADTLGAIKKRGALNCGVNVGLAGFSIPDSAGNWTGLDVDICRGIAAAIFGTGDKVKFFPYNAQQRFTALQSGEVDILSRNTTMTLTRDSKNGFEFLPVVYYDGAQFMVKTNSKFKSAKELANQSICVQSGTTTELVMNEFFNSNKIKFKPVVMAEQIDSENAFFSGRCQALVTDGSGLAAVRAGRNLTDKDYRILPEVISKEPLAAAIRKDDPNFRTVAYWTVNVLMAAEEFGITKANVDQMKSSDNVEIKRILGVEPGIGASMGIDDSWAYNAIKAVGNYGEIFERNVGQGSALKLKRGLNAQWNKGGLVYAPPIR
ncbi:MAG: amino acid ABC transporter substrate-binding protein [Candidatus Pacebacteria bacterium]|nr:amino acid ABC transporter substrate-binding protein [Candidatus Paceibacterota bacterium]